MSANRCDCATGTCAGIGWLARAALIRRALLADKVRLFGEAERHVFIYNLVPLVDVDCAADLAPKAGVKEA